MLVKSWKHGRFLILSRLPLTHEDKRALNRKDYESIQLAFRKVLKGTWRLIELAPKLQSVESRKERQEQTKGRKGCKQAAAHCA